MVLYAGKKMSAKPTFATVQHILTRNPDLAADIMAKVKKGEKFELLARRHSNCPSAKKGGDLGEFKRGVMVKPFEAAVFNAKIGEVIGPVKTKFGYHIIKVNFLR
ncbi:peptidylprolyl isomerase [Catenovulum maritimum]|uniref:Peptidyl-prolyl cis-trans isomerase C n=1 Tax=Catenovulum maritimum TaxID=1513271 RepID=A0A0J8GUI0_9ALTE|nr:peptidylprolyl isomerase [Catenovulum maritimum]KMT64343.1 peptidylprolyl isomerase [Catenovulum maritimum]